MNSNDRSEKTSESLSPGAEFDPFASNRNKPLIQGGVAVARIGKGVNVSVAGDHTCSVHFTSNGQMVLGWFCGRVRRCGVNSYRVNAPLHSSSGIDCVFAGRHFDPNLTRAAVDNTFTHGCRVS